MILLSKYNHLHYFDNEFILLYIFYMKTCPFCKKSIIEKSSICPYCKRTLIETIYGTNNKKQHKVKKTINKQFKKYINILIIGLRLNNLKKYLKFMIRNYKKIIYIFLITIIIFNIFTQKEKNYKDNNSPSISVIPTNQNLSSNSNKISHITIKNSKTYNSLENGTIFTKNVSYFNGLGVLKIKNWTNSDVIVKLVNIWINKSIFTVYLKSNSNYNINDISNGKYKLFFNQWNDWDDNIKAFLINSSYEVFEDDFNFTTYNNKYTIFSITLNPVIGWKAETEKVDVINFAKF